MAARRRAKVLSLPEPPDREEDGDIVFRLRQRSLVLTAALDGLRLYEGAWHDDEWRERVARSGTRPSSSSWTWARCTSR